MTTRWTWSGHALWLVPLMLSTTVQAQTPAPTPAPPAVGAQPAPAAPAARELTAREILDKVDDLYRGSSSHALMSMTVVTRNWQRTLGMEMWSQGKDRSLARIRSPKKEQGMATLRVGKDMWNYLPKVSRTIKVPTSMMGGSWMGSHFTNDDLVKESRMADDFDFQITFRGKRDGNDVVEITCVPKKDAAVVWGKIVVQVRNGTWMSQRMTYYDEEGALARTMVFSDVRKAGDREMPMKMVITPADKPGESTTVVYEQIAFDVKLNDQLFTKQNLRR